MATKKKTASGALQWRVRLRGMVEGREAYYFTLPPEREEEGDEFAARLEALLDRGIVPTEILSLDRPGGVKTIRELIAEYMENVPLPETDRETLVRGRGRIAPKLTGKDLTYTWAEGWVNELKREYNLSPSTVSKYVGSMRRAFSWMSNKGHIGFNPLAQLPRGFANYSDEDIRSVEKSGGKAKNFTERDRRLEPGEEERIRAILAGEKPEGRQRSLELRYVDALQLLFDMALETAMRLREMYTLSADQVDMKGRTFQLTKTKNGSRRGVPMSSVIFQRVGKYVEDLQIKGNTHLFPWWNGETSQDELKRVTSLLSRQFARIFDAAGCKDLHFHDLRHEATSRLFERTTLDYVQIAKITGHRSPTQLMRYANLRPSDLADRLW